MHSTIALISKPSMASIRKLWNELSKSRDWVRTIQSLKKLRYARRLKSKKLKQLSILANLPSQLKQSPLSSDFFLIIYNN